jgi:hypothetical protein
VNLGPFERGIWYAVRAELAREFRRLAATLAPYRLTRAALAKSR